MVFVLSTTITALSTDGFNQNLSLSRTVLATLDLSKAFDMVCHRTLVKLIYDTPLPRGINPWLSNYLNGRQATALFNNQESPNKLVRCGVPQSSVHSPTFFKFYVDDAPTPPNNVRFTSYADDFHPFSQSPDVEAASRPLNDYLHHLFNFFTSRKLSFVTSDGSVTLFHRTIKVLTQHPV